MTTPPDSSDPFGTPGGGETTEPHAPGSSDDMIEEAWVEFEPKERSKETPGSYGAPRDPRTAAGSSPVANPHDGADPFAAPHFGGETDPQTEPDASSELAYQPAADADSDVDTLERPADPFVDTGADPAGSGEQKTDESGEARRARTEELDREKASRRSFWKELPILILVALVIAILIKTFLVQVFSIPSGSMEPTLQVGDRVMVNKLAYRFGDPARGDLIVFIDPRHQSDDGSIVGSVVRHVAESIGISSPEAAVIKRIVALEGETVEVIDSVVYIDGNPLDEPYVAEANRGVPDWGPETVPADHVFVMGDNRNDSTDSRGLGAIPETSIVGRAFVRVWPFGRWGGL